MVAKKKTVKKAAKAADKAKKVASKGPARVAKKSSGKVARKAARKVVKKVAKTAASASKKTAEKATPKTSKKVVRKTAVKSKAGSSSRATSRSKAAASSGFQGFASISPIPPAQETSIEDGALIDLSEQELGMCKSGLKARDLRRYREILLEKRAELLGDVESIEKGSTAEGGNLSHMPVHMADIGSDAYEQEFNLGLLESERRLLREIEQSLMRIDKGYYGVCMLTGKPIERSRLEIKPWARYSIEAVRRREKAGFT